MYEFSNILFCFSISSISLYLVSNSFKQFVKFSEISGSSKFILFLLVIKAVKNAINSSIGNLSKILFINNSVTKTQSEDVISFEAFPLSNNVFSSSK